MIKDALEYIAQLKGQTLDPVEIDGFKYWRCAEQIITPPSPKTLLINTLNGIIDFLTAVGSPIEGDNIFISIQSYDMVTVCGQMDKYGRWPVYAKAHFIPDFGFAFDRRMKAEGFIIDALRTFEVTDELGKIMKIAGTVRSEAIRNDADDGITQIATVKKGAKLENTAIQNPVTLKHICTFPEVEQPHKQYVFRLWAGNDDSPPEMALFVAANSTWKLDVVERIHSWLTEQLDARGLSIPIVR